MLYALYFKLCFMRYTLSKQASKQASKQGIIALFFAKLKR